MLTWNEAKSLLRTVLRWWWVVLVATALSSGTAYYLSAQEVRFYVAHTTLIVGNTFYSIQPDQNQLAIGGSLARFYAELSRREPILQPVQESLQLPFAWQLISDRMLMTNVNANANLLDIYITDSNPERAAAIANAIAERLIAYSPNSEEGIQAVQQAVKQRLEDSDATIQQIKARISELTIEQQAATSASDLAEINQKLAQLNASLAQEQTSYQALLGYTKDSVVNSLSVFEEAKPPTQPLPSKRIVTIGTAGLAGLLLSLIALFILDRLDPRWRGRRDLEERFQVANLGNIPDGPPLMNAPQPFATLRLRAAHEAQTNILLAAAERGTRTLMISSPQPSEARAGFTIDLADLFARAGHKVLIVDADFTSSTITRILAPEGTQNWTVMSNDGQSDIWTHLRPTPLQNVALLPGRGEADAAPAMIPSLRWRELVQYLLNTADVILFDGPAALSGPDAALLAPHVDGVVLALDPVRDTRDDVLKSKTRLLHQKGSRLLGAVTFTPMPQQGRAWPNRQLRAPKVPELTAASPDEQLEPPFSVPPARSSPAIITPAPDDLAHEPDAAPERPAHLRPSRPAANRRPRRPARIDRRPQQASEEIGD